MGFNNPTSKKMFSSIKERPSKNQQECWYVTHIWHIKSTTPVHNEHPIAIVVLITILLHILICGFGPSSSHHHEDHNIRFFALHLLVLGDFNPCFLHQAYHFTLNYWRCVFGIQTLLDSELPPDLIMHWIERVGVKCMLCFMLIPHISWCKFMFNSLMINVKLSKTRRMYKWATYYHSPCLPSCQ